MMYVPIRHGSKTVGILSIQSYTPHAYTEQDLESLQALADHCGGALARIHAAMDLQRLERQMRGAGSREERRMRGQPPEGPGS
jgi:GAF domain-containing protein